MIIRNIASRKEIEISKADFDKLNPDNKRKFEIVNQTQAVDNTAQAKKTEQPAKTDGSNTQTDK